MAEDRALDILKQAILLERKGRAFYLQAASAADHADVRRFFEMMATEEESHIRYLADQYKSFMERQSVLAVLTDRQGTHSLTHTSWRCRSGITAHQEDLLSDRFQ